jgi:fructokinase
MAKKPSVFIGLDIGGSKIAGAVFDEAGRGLAQVAQPMPDNYQKFMDICYHTVKQLEEKCGPATSIGACAPYADDNVCSNIPFLIGKNLVKDFEIIFHCPVPFSNDANCAALAEAMEGAGREHRTVFGLIMGTGIGGGFVFDGHVVRGANGLAGEVGHLPLPSYEMSDGELVGCGCGQKGCIERLIAGPALSRLYKAKTGKDADGKAITELAQKRDPEVLKMLDGYYTTVAKAMVTVLHTFDPEIITVSGGLNNLPGLYDEVPKRWGRYAIAKKPNTKFVPAAFGAMAGLRGAAWLGRNFLVK